MVLQMDMSLLIFYKPLNKATTLICSSTSKPQSQLLQSWLGQLVCIWTEMEILGDADAVAESFP